MKAKSVSKKNGARRESSSKISLRAAWEKDVGRVRLMASAASAGLVTLCDREGKLQLFDHQGKTLFSVPLDVEAKSLSISNTSEILIVDEAGFSILVNSSGEMIWKKRLFSALAGLICGDGRFFAFISREPAIVLTDRDFHIKWSYRNILTMPSSFDVSADGEIVVFPSRNEAGTGLTAIGPVGKPFPFYTGGTAILDVALNPAGDIAFTIDKSRVVSGIETHRGVCVWKNTLPTDFHGISYSSGLGCILAYSQEGSLMLLDKTGNLAAHHQFPFSLVRARISEDGQNVWYASSNGSENPETPTPSMAFSGYTPHRGDKTPPFPPGRSAKDASSGSRQPDFPMAGVGKVGCMASGQGRDVSRQEFEEIEKPIASHSEGSFKKVWSVEFPPALKGGKPKWHVFQGSDKQNYLIIWDGVQDLLCLNEFGEEIWKNRISGEQGREISSCAAHDFVLFVSDQRVWGLKLDGNELFKFFGNYRSGVTITSGGFLLLNEAGGIEYFEKLKQFSHHVELEIPVERFAANACGNFLIGGKQIWVLDSRGKIKGTVLLPAKPTFLEMESSTFQLLTGMENGEILLINQAGEETYRNHLPSAILCAGFRSAEDMLIAASQDANELVIFHNQRKRKFRVPLRGKPVSISEHTLGTIISTAVDEILLVGLHGEVLARYTFPDRILALETPHGRQDPIRATKETGPDRQTRLETSSLNPASCTKPFFVLGEGSVTCLRPVLSPGGGVYPQNSTNS